MKKLLVISLISLVPALSFAKISDFNDMISENMQAQSQLHGSVKDQVETARIAVREKAEGNVVIVESNSESFNVKTNKDFLTFEKEKTRKAASKMEVERLASEINNSDF